VSAASERLGAALSDRYRIEGELGQGGMATVYLAQDLKHDRKVAIKVLREDLAASVGGGRFLREIKIAAQLQHPHILPLLDSGEADGFLFYVMPYVKGQSLRERLAREGELPVHDAVRLVAEVVDALVEAHGHGVVHRDIKPDNVMLTGRHALVTDFGVAKAVSEATGRNTVTTAGVALGTPAYMSPEQAAAAPNVDHRSDIYSVGVMAYEMLCGRPPFTGTTPQQVLAAHVTETPDPPSRWRDAVSPALEQVILTCLAKRAADRYQTAAELLAALEPLATPSAGVTPVETRPLTARRARWPWLVGTAALIVAAVGLVVLRRPPETLAVASTTQLTTDRGLFLDPSLSPDGKFIAYAEGAPSEMRIVVRQVEGGRPIPLAPDVPVPQRWPQWSPDGQRIAFASVGGVYVVPELGGTARRVAVTSRSAALALTASPTWSPDGARVAYARSGLVVAVDLASGRADTVSGESSGLRRLFDLRWSPDGRWIAAASGNPKFAFSRSDLGNTEAAHIALIPVAGGPAVSPLGDPTAMTISPVWLPDSRHLLWVSNSAGGRDVYELAVGRDGRPTGAPTRLTTGLDVHSISLSGDGRTMAYSSYTPSASIWTIALSPGAPASSRSAVPLTHGTDVIEETLVSPDHRTLLVTSNRTGRSNLFLIPIEGGPATPLTTSDSLDIFLPGWSLDGKEVCFVTGEPGVRTYTIPAAGGVPSLVADSTSYCSWSPDGRSMVLQAAGPDASRGSRASDRLAVVHREAAGWGPARAVPGGSNAGSPEWSPDGRWIAYVNSIRDPVSDATRTAVALLSPDGGTPRLLTPTAGHGPQPTRVRWSDDSREIYYRAVDSVGVGTIWSVAVTGGPPRPLVRFDDPERTGGDNKGFSIVAGKVYTRIMTHESSIGIATLRSR
jgi:eukaryotic-like serine/threonine-protein kinase